jgi:hypothetical protein
MHELVRWVCLIGFLRVLLYPSNEVLFMLLSESRAMYKYWILLSNFYETAAKLG